MTALFVMPHFSSDFNETFYSLEKAIESTLLQTDGDWMLLIIDDNSPDQKAICYLQEVELKYPGKIIVIFNEKNVGPGASRNVGVTFAQTNNFPFILFIDADDVSHQSRLSVCRAILEENHNASVVYTTFSVVDEFSHPVSVTNLSPSIKEILNSHKISPPQGENAWIDIGTNSGYTNLTSATAVRTDLAARYLFPNERVSEDAHTWLRYSAGGGNFVFTPLIPTQYRIPQHVEGSVSRMREGGNDSFYMAKARVDEDGFKQAFKLAVSNGKVQKEEYQLLMLKFHLKLATTLLNVKQLGLAGVQIKKANLIIDSYYSDPQIQTTDPLHQLRTVN